MLVRMEYLVGEWINQLWYVQTVEYYSSLKRNELSSHENIWENLKCILLSERSQSEIAIACDSSYMTFSKGKTMETVKRSLLLRVREW